MEEWCFIPAFFYERAGGVCTCAPLTVVKGIKDTVYMEAEYIAIDIIFLTEGDYLIHDFHMESIELIR